MSGSGSDATCSGVPVADPVEVLGQLPTGHTLRRELAAAARSRGRESSVATEIAATHERLAAIAVPDVDLAGARKRLAEATGEEERLKERVAAARGELRARREVGATTADAVASLEEAAAALSSAQTERVAAEQALNRRRERAAEARDVRDRRLELQDRLANLRREAGRELARETYPAFRAALAAVPCGSPQDAGSSPSAYAGPELPASFAAVRIAELPDPVVVDRNAWAVLDGKGPAVPPAAVLDAEVSVRTRLSRERSDDHPPTDAT